MVLVKIVANFLKNNCKGVLFHNVFGAQLAAILHESKTTWLLLLHVYKIVWTFLKNELGGKKKTVERLFKNYQINLSDIYLILEDIEDLEDIRRYRKGLLNLWM